MNTVPAQRSQKGGSKSYWPMPVCTQATTSCSGSPPRREHPSRGPEPRLSRPRVVVETRGVAAGEEAQAHEPPGNLRCAAPPGSGPEETERESSSAAVRDAWAGTRPRPLETVEVVGEVGRRGRRASGPGRGTRVQVGFRLSKVMSRRRKARSRPSSSGRSASLLLLGHLFGVDFDAGPAAVEEDDGANAVRVRESSHEGDEAAHGVTADHGVSQSEVPRIRTTSRAWASSPYPDSGFSDFTAP